MSMIEAGPGRMELSEAGRTIHRHYQQLLRTRRIYSLIALGGVATLLFFAVWFANDNNAGKFLDRLP